jgi:hypothetical protein
MKKYLFLCLLFSGYCFTLHAQVKIGGTPVAPVPSAVLELDGGTTRGLLLPRMRKVEIDAIQNPAEGLTIYATDEQAVYLRKSLVWEKQVPFSLPYSGTYDVQGPVLYIENSNKLGQAIRGISNDGVGLYGWSSYGSGVYGVSDNTGAGGTFAHAFGGTALATLGKTGLGTFNPKAILHVDATNTNTDAMIINDLNPTLQLQSYGVDKGFLQTSGNDFRLGTNATNGSGSIIMRTKGIDRVQIDSTGKMNIGSGTNSPDMLNVFGGGISIDDGITPSLRFKNGNLPIFTLYQQSGMINFYSPSSGFQFGDGNTTFFRLKPTTGAANFTNRIGISMDIPQALLHINGFDSNVPAMLMDDYDPLIQLQNNSVNKGYFQVDGNDMVMATNSTNTSGKIVMRTNNVDRLFIDNAGNVAIGGTPPPPTYKLAVKGKIAATDFTVVASGSWPDYVFSPSYKLRSLEETEAYIKEHKHLPNIPAAAVVEKEGFALGDMQKRMMEKIEELTLHLIEANKALKEFRSSSSAEIEQLKQQVQILQGKK